MFWLNAKIVSNKRMKDNHFLCSLAAPAISKEARPGQFVNIKAGDTTGPLLRRPLSIHRVIGPRVEILYEVLGQGTQMLSRQKPGEFLDIIGPLGNGFDYTSPRHHVTTSPVLVAGGIGVAPLLFLAERLACSVEREAHRKARASKLSAKRYPCLTGRQALNAVVLIGAKTKNHILCEAEFRKLGCEVKVATDDGSKGFRGYVSDLLKHVLSTIDYRLSTIYACGPKPMLKEIARLSIAHAIPAQISLEEHMSCGFGACLGCVVKVRQAAIKGKSEFEYVRVCKEGPVFNAQHVVWE